MRIFLATTLTLICVAFVSAQNRQSPINQPTPPQAGSSSVNDNASSSQVNVYFYRARRIWGAALEPPVYCNGVELARMDNGRYFGIRLDPGRYTFGTGNRRRNIEIDIQPGQVYYVSMDIVTAGIIRGYQGRLTLAQNEQGANEVRNLRPLGRGKVRDHLRVIIFEDDDANERASPEPPNSTPISN